MSPHNSGTFEPSPEEESAKWNEVNETTESSFNYGNSLLLYGLGVLSEYPSSRPQKLLNAWQDISDLQIAIAHAVTKYYKASSNNAFFLNKLVETPGVANLTFPWGNFRSMNLLYIATLKGDLAFAEKLIILGANPLAHVHPGYPKPYGQDAKQYRKLTALSLLLNPNHRKRFLNRETHDSGACKDNRVHMASLYWRFYQKWQVFHKMNHHFLPTFYPCGSFELNHLIRIWLKILHEAPKKANQDATILRAINCVKTLQDMANKVTGNKPADHAYQIQLYAAARIINCPLNAIANTRLNDEAAIPDPEVWSTLFEYISHHPEQERSLEAGFSKAIICYNSEIFHQIPPDKAIRATVFTDIMLSCSEYLLKTKTITEESLKNFLTGCVQGLVNSEITRSELKPLSPLLNDLDEPPGLPDKPPKLTDKPPQYAIDRKGKRPMPQHTSGPFHEAHQAVLKNPDEEHMQIP